MCDCVHNVKRSVVGTTVIFNGVIAPTTAATGASGKSTGPLLISSQSWSAMGRPAAIDAVTGATVAAQMRTSAPVREQEALFIPNKKSSTEEFPDELDFGDVFADGGDILELQIADSGGLEKVNNKLEVYYIQIL